MIVNYDPSTDGGSHWIAIYAHNPYHATYFDSLGNDVPVDTIRSYLRTNFRNVTRIVEGIQKPGSSVCGQYAIVFVYLSAMNFSVRKIRSLMVGTGDADKFVEFFVRELVKSHRLAHRV